MNRLKIENGSRAGEVVDLASGGLTLGSDPKASAVAFEDSRLASVHFRVAPVKGGGFGIQDLGSTAGTAVNGKRIAAHRLVHGDRIQAGGLTLTFESTDSVAALPPTPVPASAPLVKAASPSNTDTPAPAGRAQDPDLSGKTLGGYQIEKILGRGGMGTVYKATQTSLHRTVALKVLSPALARDPKFVEMFLKEARGAAQLHHPNVVTIFDVGSDGEYHYFSMEIFEGGSVEQLLRREKKLDAPRALAMVRDAAAALDFAEAKRVLHRDVKPDNLMISAHGVVKLADLGLAVRRGEVSAARIGTPHFLAPECIRGGTVDHRADLYALGATLFRLLTGRTPFQGANVNEILENAQTKEAPALRTLDSTIPEPVEALVSKLLQKDPAKRPANSKEVLAAIDAILGPGSAAAPSRVKKIAAGIAVLAALVLVAIVVFKPKPPENDKPTVVRDTATETRLMREKEAKEKELREKDAELALARIPEKLTPAERISRFESIVKDFTGTPAAIKAQQEAERVRAEEAARVERERVKAVAVGQYRIDLEKRIQENLTAGRFADAIAAPKGLEGFQDAIEDPDAKAAIEVVPERVTSAVETQTKDQLNRALEFRNAGKLDEALKAYQKLADSLRSLIALPREEVGDARLARFQTLLTAVEGSMKELAKGRDEVLARNLTAARASARKLLLAALEGARAGKPAPLTELAAFDGAALGDDTVKTQWGEIQVNARAYATYLTRLQEANVSKDFGAETFVDPLTGKPARIVGFDDGGLRFESKPGAAPTGVPLDRLGAVKVSQLFARFTPRTSDAALLLSRATLFASWAFDTARLVQYELALKLDAASFEAPPAAEDDGFQAALDSLQSAGDGAAAAAEPLRKQIESERAATRKLREGLTAFAAGRYGDAERNLSEFLSTARGSLAHFLASSSAAAATPPK